MNYNLYRPYSLLKFLSITVLSFIILTFVHRSAKAQCSPAAVLAGVTVSYTITDLTCNGNGSGSVAITINGGGAPYTFTILGGSIPFQTITKATNIHTFSGLPADPSFFINIQTKIGIGFGVCTFAGLAINEPAPITITSTITDVLCSGASTGAIALSSVSGGTAPYTYAWSNGAITQNVAGLTAGAYSVTITDANLCPQVFNFTINEPPPIAITSTTTDVLCNGASTGAITLNTVTGGVAPYTFAWSNGAITQNINGLTAGPYSVTVTDANLCPQVFNFTINEPPPIAITSTTVDVLCNGGSTGSITLNTVTGGVAPYTFAWSNGAITQNITGLAVGPYSVTITDANLCLQVFNFNINQPTPIAITSTTVDVLCNGGNTGSITLNTVAGGVAPYTFAWSNGALTQNIAGLAVGPYSVTITDANLCPQVLNFNITEPTPIAITSTTVDVLCNGGTTGSITLNTVTGGVAPYTFAWSNGAITQNIVGLTEGPYSVTVTDANLCPQVFNFNIIGSTPIAITSTTVDVLCNGGNTGSITLNAVTGGVAPYTFAWSNGAITQNIAGLAAGPYSVTITDANLCPQVFNFNIIQTTPIAITATTLDVLCNGGSTGSITLNTVTGGVAAYTFAWSNGAITQNIAGLAAGPYSITVTDANLCPQVFNFTINPAPPIVVTSTTVDVLCNGGSTGSITLNTVTGGLAPYTFAWSNGAVTQNIAGLAVGPYSVTITDANLCPQVFNFNVIQSTPIAITSTTVDVLCNGGSTGSITLNTITGGVAPYTFAWSNGAITQNLAGLAVGPYSVTITDANLCPQVFNFNIIQPTPIAITSTTMDVLCNGGSTGSITLNTVTGGLAPYTFTWSNGAITQNIAGLAVGPYSVTITDANLCPQVFNFNITQPTPIAITSTSVDVLCNGGSTGSITLNTVTGGVAPYTFAWSNGAITQNIAGIAAGPYSVTVTDANLCPQVFNFNITQPTPIAITSTTVDVVCNGGSTGSITLNTVTGGIAPYTFAWSNGAITQNIAGLAAGPYSVTITDGNLCPQVFNFVINESTPIAITSNVTNTTTCGGNDGAIDIVTVSGSTAPYTFLWSTGAITQNITGLTAGPYAVTITDANLCPQVFNFSVSDPTPFTVTPTIVDVTCNGAGNGSITHVITGGTAPFSILWNTGAITQNLVGLSGGNYTVTITDASNCSYNGNYTINEPALISITSTTSNITSCGGSDGSITLTAVSGGIAPYTFAWSNGAVSQNLVGLLSGPYSVTITDANLCPQVFNFALSEPTPFTVSAVITDLTCNGANNGSIIHTITGGTAPFTILWNTGAVTQDLLGIAGGSYTVTITDASSCSYNGNYTVNEPSPISITSFVSNSTSCGGNDGTITLTTVTGGTAPYTFAWNNGAITQNLTGLSAGAYTVTITDANLCTSLPFNFNVTDPVPFIVTSVVNDVTCNGGSDGAIDQTIVGGTLPFTFVWSNGANTEDINGLTTGTYTVTITDAGACSSIGSYTINEPTPIVVTSSSIDVTCNAGNNGSITLITITGGIAPYTFLWSNGASTQNVAGLSAGPYSVTVSDANGCPQVLNFIIAEPAAMTDNTTLTNVTTCGGNDGAITINAILGGTPTYTFLWNTGAITQNLVGLTAGLYSVTVTDANTCSQAFSYTISDPVTFVVTPTIVDVVCNSNNTGSISLAIVGGVAPYTILWNTGAVTANIINLVAGAYSVSITDASGCSFNSLYSVTEPSAITIVSSVTNASNCSANDGAITLTSISGGIAPYSFLWNTGAITQNISALTSGLYDVTITDANLCPQNFSFAVSNPTPFTVVPTIVNAPCNGNGGGSISLLITGGVAPISVLWNTGALTNTITNLSAGTYTVTVNDASSTCSFNGSYTILEPNAVDTLSIVTTLTPVICPGSNEGSVLLSNVTGGTPAYTYILGGVSSPIPSFTTLLGGAYTMTIRDNNGCDFFHSFIIIEPNPIAYTVTTTLPVCTNSNGSISFDPVTGGTPPYVYSIDGGVTYSNQITYTNLAPNVYSVFVRDASMCTYGYLVPLAIKQGPVPYIRLKNTTCFSGSDGAIIIDSIFSGVSPFNFYINGEDRGSSKVFTSLGSGTYTLMIQDQDCTYDIFSYFLWNGNDYDTINSQLVPIGQPAPVTAETSSLVNTDRGNENGIALVTNFTGGTAPYYYSLDTLATPYFPIVNDTLIFGELDKGSYKVFLLDTNGCKGEVIVKIYVSFFIPNLITPNGDGQNDYFEIMALPRGSTLQIYNSWNERVYFNKNYDNSWDAPGLSNGVYYYDLLLPNGKSYKGWIQTLN